MTNRERKSNYIEDLKIANKMTSLYKHLPKGRKAIERSEKSVLNENGEAPQCSCTIKECTNMEYSLPQNHLEHTTSASVHKTKHST